MELLLIGGGGHCKAVIDVVEATRTWRIAGIVEAPGSNVREVLGYPVIGFDDELENLYTRDRAAIVTVGQIKTPAVRARLFARLSKIGFTLPTIVSPLAHVARSATLGAGSIVMHFAQVGADARVGQNTIVNSRALIEHDAAVGDHCHIATASVINGGATVGDSTLVGSGAICREYVAVGQRCIIAMGARVRKSVPDDTVYYGETR